LYLERPPAEQEIQLQNEKSAVDFSELSKEPTVGG